MSDTRIGTWPIDSIHTCLAEIQDKAMAINAVESVARRLELDQAHTESARVVEWFCDPLRDGLQAAAMYLSDDINSDAQRLIDGIVGDDDEVKS